MTSERQLRNQIRQQKRKVVSSVFIGLTTLLMVMFILSQPAIQERLFHPLLITYRGQIVAAVVLIAVGLIAALPIIIEANFHTRNLSRPGRIPPGKHSPTDNQ
jgi:Cu/Ag efflux pump CusA